ncbi:MAG: stage V sporulation protein AD [Ruminococcaceae bacterium]|nr:stage V sporulation protein AD [Oscillospiraceae bacterium]
MAERIGEFTVSLSSRPTVWSSAAIVGKKEGEGPMAKYFDTIETDTRMGQDSWEKAESMFQKKALSCALNKAGLAPSQLQYLFAGDLLNQCTASAFGLRESGVPLLGQYGACSTMAQTLAMAAIFVDSGAADLCAAVTSSHFCSAERQFRYPLAYGGQRTPTAQWTATAAGCAVVGMGGKGAHIREVCAGRVVDLGITDANNMGAAMAPAAADTLSRFLDDTDTKPSDYDLILTGDLALCGSRMFHDLLSRKGIVLSDNYNDCGLMIFDRDKQDVHAGGSGCGCAASVLCGYVLPALERGELRNVLFMATGALMSTTSSKQGESIPGIAHLLHLTAE